MSGSETNEGVAKDKVLPELVIESGTLGPKPGTLSTRLPLHPFAGLVNIPNNTKEGIISLGYIGRDQE